MKTRKTRSAAIPERAAMASQWRVPWAMERESLQNFLSSSRAIFRGGRPKGGGAFQSATISVSQGGNAPQYVNKNGAAIIPVIGPLTKYPDDFLCRFAGWTATVQIQEAIAAAMDDSDVARIVMFFDTPGGVVSGTPDLADFIYGARGQKPIDGWISDMCASGGYWLASQCNRVIANPAAFIGSIGVYSVLVDYSQAAANEGVAVHVVSDGEFKGLTEEGLPISEKALADRQRMVSQISTLFRAAVARGRGMDENAVMALADGRVHLAQEALGLGLIDQIGVLDAAVNLEGAMGNTNSITTTTKANPAPKADAGADNNTPDVAEVCQKILDALTALTQKVDKMNADAGDDDGDDGKKPLPFKKDDTSASPEDATTKAMAANNKRLADIMAGCGEGRDAFALKAFLEGKSAVEAKAALADELAKENKTLRGKQASAEDGTEALALGGPKASGTNSAEGVVLDEAQLKAAWDANQGDARVRFHGSFNAFKAYSKAAANGIKIQGSPREGD